MDKKQYQDIQTKLFDIWESTAGMDMDEFISAINKAELAAPVLDPTLYRAGAENVKVVKRMAEKLRAFQQSGPSAEEKARMLVACAQHQQMRC